MLSKCTLKKLNAVLFNKGDANGLADEFTQIESSSRPIAQQHIARLSRISRRQNVILCGTDLDTKFLDGIDKKQGVISNAIVPAQQRRDRSWGKGHILVEHISARAHLLDKAANAPRTAAAHHPALPDPPCRR